MFNNVSIFGPEPCLVLGRGAVLGAIDSSDAVLCIAGDVRLVAAARLAVNRETCRAASGLLNLDWRAKVWVWFFELV